MTIIKLHDLSGKLNKKMKLNLQAIICFMDFARTLI